MAPATAFQLDNGLRFIVAEDHAAPVAAVSLWVRAGVCDEPPARRGIAHFLEHMMFRGSENFAPEEHARRIARLGGESNAFTLPDATVFLETVPAYGLEEALRLEADRFQHLRFRAEHVEIERKVILEELHVHENQPVTRALRRMLAEIGGRHPYALDPLGRAEDLKALTLEDLAAFHRACYRPGRVFGVVAGDVDRRRVEELARKHFGAWNGADAPGPAVERFLPRVGALSLRLPLEVPLVVRLHRVPPPAEEDVPAVDLLVALLTSGEASPLRETLVKNTRLCVEAAGEYFRLRHGGILVLFAAFMPPGRHAPRRKILSALCNEIVERGPDPALFARHLKQFRKQRAHDAYSPSEKMMGLGEAEMLEGDFRKYEEGLEDLARVTPERVQAAARRLFAPGNTLELDIHPETSKWYLAPLGLLWRLWPR